MENGNRCALITGASMGLGRALALECAERGMNLFLVALPGSGLSALADSIAESYEVDVEWLEGDLTEPDTLERLHRRVASDRLRIDLLINNAGMGIVGQFMDHTLQYHEATIELNTLSLVKLIRLLLPELKSAKASILNVASLGAFFPMPTMSIYSATKSFVLHFSLALREELRGSVGVSVLCPNAIRTGEGVNEYIDKLGLLPRLACFSPEFIARKALDGLARGRAVIVPGAINRIVAGLSQVVPRPLINKTIRYYWGNYLRSTASERPVAAGLPSR